MEVTKQPKKIPVFNETISFQSYRDTIEFLQTNWQLIDASLDNTYKTLSARANQTETLMTALKLDKDQHNRLHHPLKQHSALLKLSRKKNIEFAIIQLYNHFTKYLKDVTAEMFSKNPMFIVNKAVYHKDGEDKESHNLTYAEIIRLSSYENVQEEIISRVFRSIEELRSTTKLLDRILQNTKVNLPNKTKDNALAYLEMRHLYIHNRGLVDAKFASKYGGMFSPELKKGRELPSKLETINGAIKTVTLLCSEIDKQLIANGFIPKRQFKTNPNPG